MNDVQLQTIRKQRQLYFLRVGENCKLLTELFIIQTNGSDASKRWFQDRHLQEVVTLLRDPVKVKVVSYYEQARRNRRKREKENNETKKKKSAQEEAEILTGQSVKIGYKFTSSYLHYNSCLMPAEMGAPVWMPSTNDKHAGGGFGYSRLFPKKLVVHVCQYCPAVMASSTNQLMRSMSASPRVRNPGISSYFSRTSDPDFAEPILTKSATKQHSKLKRIVKGMLNPSTGERESGAKAAGSLDGGGFLQTTQSPPDSLAASTSDVLPDGKEFCGRLSDPVGHSGSASSGSSCDDVPSPLSTRVGRRVDAALVSSVKESSASRMPLSISSSQQCGEKNSSDGNSCLPNNVELMETVWTNLKSEDVLKSPSCHIVESVPSAGTRLKSPGLASCDSKAGKPLQTNLKDYAYQPKCKNMNRMKLSLKRLRKPKAVMDETERKEEGKSDSQVSQDCVVVGSSAEKETNHTGSKLRETLSSTLTSGGEPPSLFQKMSAECQSLKEGGDFLTPTKSSKSPLKCQVSKAKKASCSSVNERNFASTSSEEELMTTSFLHPPISSHRSPVNVQDASSIASWPKNEGSCWRNERNKIHQGCSKQVKRKKDEIEGENLRKDDDIACSPLKKVHRPLTETDNKLDGHLACPDGNDQVTIESDEDPTEALDVEAGTSKNVLSSVGQTAEDSCSGDEVIFLSQKGGEDSDNWFDSIFGDIRYIRELKEEDVAFLIKRNKGYLRSIFLGKRVCERHQCYKEKGLKRREMAGNVRLGPFREEQMDVVMGELVKMYCRKHFKYMDYISKVLLPEAMTKICMDVHGVDHVLAEAVMRGAREEPPRTLP